MVRKQGRPKAGQEALTQEKILRVALALVDRDGVERLSMRRLASELDVDPMAIYHHVASKQALLSGIVDLVFAELQVRPEDGATWQQQIEAFAHAYRRLAMAHPNLVLHLITDAEAGAGAALMANELLYRALAAAGLSPQMVVRAGDLIVDFLNGYVLGESTGRLGQPGERGEMLAQLDQQPAGSFPTLRRVFATLRNTDALANFDVELAIVLAGIEVLANRNGAALPE